MKNKKKGPKILLLDIESVPNEGVFWRCGYKLNIGYENILKERSICVIGYKWLDGAKVVSRSTGPRYSERQLLLGISKILAQADAVVAHNGDKFDLPYIRTRTLFHNLPVLPKPKQIDTLKIARKTFMFNSNRLDYLGRFLGLGNKIKTEFGLWLEFLRGDKRAAREMVRYNKQDVLLLEKVYKRLAPHVPESINRALFGTGVECPHCGSTRVQKRGWHYTKVARYQKFQCKDCGAWSKANKAVTVKALRTSL